MFSSELAQRKAKIDADIAEHSQLLFERWQREFGLETAQVFDSYLSILSRGGKRLRGILGMWAYELAGGNDEALAIRLARSLEMIHAYLLVIDDVADRSELRRGGPTAHRLLEKYHDDEGWFGDNKYFGRMQAVNAGLAAQHLVMQEITELAASDSTKLEAVRELSAVLFKTVAGQIADLNFQAMREATEHEIIAEMERKTAIYSFVCPLQLGVIMAAKDWSDYGWLEQWAVNIGLSFQISDDILGIFGDPKLSGKSSLSDIREGKITLLIVRAMSRTSVAQKNQLLRHLGNQEANQSELEQTQVIIEDTGALDYCQRLASDYAQKAIASLGLAPAEQTAQTVFLDYMTRTIVNRQT